MHGGFLVCMRACVFCLLGVHVCMVVSWFVSVCVCGVGGVFVRVCATSGFQKAQSSLDAASCPLGGGGTD